MIKIENVQICGWEPAIRGMRNPLNSWAKSDSHFQFGQVLCKDCVNANKNPCGQECLDVGPNDKDLMERLAKGGPAHAKYRRMITVYVDVTAPLYWWKEFDTYRVGVAPNPTDIEMNSCSTMHKIHAKEFTLEDFSTEHLIDDPLQAFSLCDTAGNFTGFDMNSKEIIQFLCNILNYYRQRYLETKDKKYWWQMIQLLPSSYNQKRTVMLNYEVLANIYRFRKDHKLDEWAEHKNIDTETLKRFYDGEFKLRDEKSLNDIGFCDWIKTLPYSELITGEEK